MVIQGGQGAYSKCHPGENGGDHNKSHLGERLLAYYSRVLSQDFCGDIVILVNLSSVL